MAGLSLSIISRKASHTAKEIHGKIHPALYKNIKQIGSNNGEITGLSVLAEVPQTTSNVIVPLGAHSMNRKKKD